MSIQIASLIFLVRNHTRFFPVMYIFVAQPYPIFSSYGYKFYFFIKKRCATIPYFCATGVTFFAYGFLCCAYGSKFCATIPYFFQSWIFLMRTKTLFLGIYTFLVLLLHYYFATPILPKRNDVF